MSYDNGSTVQVPAAAPKAKKVRVSDKDFVKAYVACYSTDEAAKLTGLANASVQQRAAKLRKAGVRLP